MNKVRKVLGKSFPPEYWPGRLFEGEYFGVKISENFFSACIFTLSGTGSHGWIDVCIDQPGGYVIVTLSDDEISDYIDMKYGIPRINKGFEEKVIQKAIEVIQNENSIHE